jgi:aryl-alcohol dehydrogenase-like predicted oxidoreductase
MSLRHLGLEQIPRFPGTSSVAHLQDNIAAAQVKVTDSEYAALESAVD